MDRQPRHLKRFTTRLGFSAAVLAATASLATAQQVTVPDQYGTIQSAINAVINGTLADGTTILVRPGTYAEVLNVANTARSFTVRSSGGAGVTVVNAAGRGAAGITVYRATGRVIFVGLTVRNAAPPVAAGGGFVVTQSSPTFEQCVFESNRANYGGGGTLITSNAIFSGTVIRNNIAERSGGGVYMIDGSRPVFTASAIVGNRSGAGPAGVGNAGVGGGIDSRNGSPIFRGSQISGNTATFAGGGIYHGGEFGSPYGTATLLIEDSEIADNVVSAFSASDGPAEGGGVHIEDNSVAQVTRTRVLRNRSNTGGGLSAYRARYDLVDSAVEGNSATGRSDGGIGGGITGSSTHTGGTVRPSSVITLTRSLVRNNVGLTGGGVVATGDVGRPATMTITGSVIDGNQAQSQGGGILISNANLTASNTLVIRNTVAGSLTPFGGGLMIATSSAATISGSTLAENSAAKFGGGIFMDGTARLDMDGSRIFNNTTSDSDGYGGGGLFVGPNGSNTGSVVNSIIADNAQYQIFENGCPKTQLTYNNNTITPRVATTTLYVTACSPFQPVTSIATFNGLSNTSGNNSNLPRFAHFLGAPQAGTRFTLAWSVARATSVAISGVGSFNAATGTADVTPGGSANYSMTASASSANGGSYSAVSSSVTYVAPPSAGPSRRSVPSDFDGDGLADLTVYRPGNGTWYIRYAATGATAGVQWGVPGDVPVAGDYDGDGRADAAVFRPGNGTWYLRYTATGGTAGMQWGASSDLVVPADYDGDGKTDVAVFRPSTGTWYIRYSGTGASTSVQWGASSDVPVQADYDGDGKADVAIFRPSSGTWYVRYSGTGATGGFQWGSGADVPVVADYDGDQRADLAVFRPSNGTWYLWYSTTNTTAGVQWGAGSDRSMPADYDGDGRADFGLFRPGTGTWYLWYSSNAAATGVQWGTGNDMPIPKRP